VVENIVPHLKYQIGNILEKETKGR